MTRYTTNSWQARAALAAREPYTTGGAMRAIEGSTGGFAHTGRLPDPYDTQYREASVEGRITYTVLSYATPIAWVLEDGQVVIPPVKYSITTTNHQGLLYALRQPADGALADAATRERTRARERAVRRLEEKPPGGADQWADLPSRNPVVTLRPVPANSGEGAIYSPEYLHRHESAHGTDPEVWRDMPATAG